MIRILKKKYAREMMITLGVILIIYALIAALWNNIAFLFSQLPVLGSLHDLLSAEIQKKSIIGLSAMTFFGGLFFLAYSAELLFLLYARAGYSVIYLSAVMIIFTMLSQAANYSIGYFIEKKILHSFVKDRKREFLTSLRTYDVTFIIIINIVPLPADILSLVLGMVRYDFKKTMVCTLIGKVIKFMFLSFIFAISRIV